MSDLIDRQDAINAIYHHFPHMSMKLAAMVLYEVPSAQTERAGTWLLSDGYRCSKCNYKLQTTGFPSYCPNCGARMGERIWVI